MKIISWNVWSENTSFSQVTSFISKQNADVICLQEVSKKLLRRLQKIPKHTIVSAIDCYFVKSKRKKIPYFLVILSKLPIVVHQPFSIPTVQYESIVSQILGLEECIEGQYIDIMQKEKKIRIFNVHFQSYVRPRIRLGQFESVVSQFSDVSKNIICGDFNTFGFWHFNMVVGWIYNYSWEEFFMDEKSSLEGMLKNITTEARLQKTYRNNSEPCNWKSPQRIHISLESESREGAQARLQGSYKVINRVG